MTIKEEFEKAFKGYSFTHRASCKDGAKWMAERCAVAVMGEDLPSTVIRQLAKALDD